MQFTLEPGTQTTWQLRLTGTNDQLIDLLTTYCGDDIEQALDHFDTQAADGSVTVDLADCETEQEAARALLELITNTASLVNPGYKV